MTHRLNKTMDRDDLFKPSYRQAIEKLEDLMSELRERGLKYTNYWGGFEELGEIENANRGGVNYEPYPNAFDDKRIPWFKYWEIAHVFLNSGIKDEQGCRCLDLGGCSSIFSYLLASMGYETHVIDIKKGLVENGNKVAKEMGWNMYNYEMDIADMGQLKGYFDYIFSLCVFEHMPLISRVEDLKQVKNLLCLNGVFAITFDYLNPNPKAQINSKQAIYDQFIIPSGMKLRGSPFKDNGKRYLFHEDGVYTFGALFMRG